MSRRRRGRRGAGRQKSPKASANVPAVKEESPSPKQSPQRTSGRGRRPRPSLTERVARWIEEFPPTVEKMDEFVKVCGELRSSPAKREEVSLSQEETFYWLASGVESLAEEELDRLFNDEYREPLSKIRTQHALEEDKYWKPDDPAIPQEYQNLLDDFRVAKRKVLAKAFEKYGDPETAQLVQEDYSAYLSKREEGKRRFFARDALESFQIPEELDVPAQPEQTA